MNMTPAEARAIAKEAYIYGFPMVDNMREIIERSRARYKATGWISLAEMRRKYGVPAKPKRRAAPRTAR
jgi:hypothetical protein